MLYKRLCFAKVSWELQDRRYQARWKGNVDTQKGSHEMEYRNRSRTTEEVHAVGRTGINGKCTICVWNQKSSQPKQVLLLPVMIMAVFSEYVFFFRQFPLSIFLKELNWPVQKWSNINVGFPPRTVFPPGRVRENSETTYRTRILLTSDLWFW